MMGKKTIEGRDQMSMISLDDLVPKNHLLRKVDMLFSFDFIYDEVRDLYSPVGKESIDPIVLFKICFIQYLFGIRSMRRTIEEINCNVAYRWFLGYNFNETIPHFSTFGKNYARRFVGTEIFEVIFSRILDEISSYGLLSPDTIFVDGTHTKASANKSKFEKTLVEKSSEYYKEELEKEINEVRKAHGKKPLKKKEITELKVFKQSGVDPDAGLFWKNERERMMCYSINAACDRYGFILGSHVSSGNMHDSKNYQPLLLDVLKRFPGEIKLLAADAGYIAPHIAKLTADNNIRICLPYKRPMTKKGYFKKFEYIYDEYYDVYICPNEKLLKYTTTSRAGKNIYKSNPEDCLNCDKRIQCTQSSNHQKVIERHVWQDYLDEANHQRHTKLNKEVYKLRSETIERRFGDAKEKHGMRYTKYRGLQKNADHTMLIFACMNLKKMVNQIA